MGCKPCSENIEKNKHKIIININNQGKRNEKKLSLLSDQNNTVNLNSKSPFISYSCNNIHTNYRLEKLEKEISEIDKKGNKENIEQKETKEEDKEKKIRKNPNLLHNIENNGINDDDKINVGIKNESKNEGANQLIIVDDDELVPSQSINEANIILNNNSKNSNVIILFL